MPAKAGKPSRRDANAIGPAWLHSAFGMTVIPTTEEVKRFASLGYATDAFKFARFDCEHLSRVKEINSMSWLSRVTSLVTHYARPFKRSRDLLPLDASIVPSRYRSLHQRLIEARDKAHAHLDGDLRCGSNPIHQVRLVKQRDGRHFWTPARIIFWDRAEIGSVASLLDCLIDQLDKETDALEALLLPHIKTLAPGLYCLSSAPPFFERDAKYGSTDRLSDLGPIN